MKTGMTKPLNGEDLAKRETCMSLPGQSLAHLLLPPVPQPLRMLELEVKRGL